MPLLGSSDVDLRCWRQRQTPNERVHLAVPPPSRVHTVSTRAWEWQHLPQLAERQEPRRWHDVPCPSRVVPLSYGRARLSHLSLPLRHAVPSFCCRLSAGHHSVPSLTFSPSLDVVGMHPMKKKKPPTKQDQGVRSGRRLIFLGGPKGKSGIFGRKIAFFFVASSKNDFLEMGNIARELPRTSVRGSPLHPALPGSISAPTSQDEFSIVRNAASNLSKKRGEGLPDLLATTAQPEIHWIPELFCGKDKSQNLHLPKDKKKPRLRHQFSVDNQAECSISTQPHHREHEGRRDTTIGLVRLRRLRRDAGLALFSGRSGAKRALVASCFSASGG